MPTGAYANLPTMGWHNPFCQLNLLKRQMDRLSDAMFHRMPLQRFVSPGLFPAVNLTEDETNYYLRAELPGLKSGDLDVQIIGRKVSLAGERKITHVGEGARYHRREREAGRFSRVIELPEEIDARAVKARLTHGLMTVAIPKAAAAMSKRIIVG